MIQINKYTAISDEELRGRNLRPAMLFSGIDDAPAGGKDTVGASRL